jgi:hypothetical protein
MRRALAVIIFLCSPVLLSASLVTNGSFETGDFTGWSDSGFANVFCTAGFAESGNCAADMDGDDGVVSQAVTTVAGDSYTFDFWYYLTGQQLTVKWDGQVVFSSDTSVDWTHEVVANLTATTNSTTIEFDATTFSTPPMRLDNVDVVYTPEPSTALLLLVPAALLWMRRRQITGRG